MRHRATIATPTKMNAKGKKQNFNNSVVTGATTKNKQRGNMTTMRLIDPERFKEEMARLSQMRHTDKKLHDVILWSHVREMERRLTQGESYQ